MTSCGFRSLAGISSPCGSSKYQKQCTESIILIKCIKDVKGHFKRLNTFVSDVKDEATLILARAGMLHLIPWFSIPFNFDHICFSYFNPSLHHNFIIIVFL